MRPLGLISGMCKDLLFLRGEIYVLLNEKWFWVRRKSVFCENMKCKFSLLLRDLAILYYRTKGWTGWEFRVSEEMLAAGMLSDLLKASVCRAAWRWGCFFWYMEEKAKNLSSWELYRQTPQTTSYVCKYLLNGFPQTVKQEDFFGTTGKLL